MRASTLVVSTVVISIATVVPGTGGLLLRTGTSTV
jgi:hypothetical protein